MTLAPQGRDRVWNRTNVLAWMRQHGAGAADYAELADQAARAFGVAELLAAHEPGDGGELAWVWDLALEVVGERDPGRPKREDYAPCRCTQAQYYGFSDQTVCGGCHEYDAARDAHGQRPDHVEDARAAADALNDIRKDEGR
jgi:hypothetical protein